MSQQNRTTLKNYFRTGQRPTQEQFADMIDSSLNLTDDGIFDDGGNLGLGHSNPASNLSVNGNVTVSPNNDSAPDNGLFVHGNVGIGAGFTNPTAQLAVKGSVYIGNTETTDPGTNSLKVDGNIKTEGNLSITGALHAVGDTTMGGNLTLADARHVTTDEVRARDSGGLKLYVANGANGLMIHDNGNVSIGGSVIETHKLYVGGSLRVTSDTTIDGNLTLADARHVATDEVRARDSGGLKLYVASGANGLMIHDNGNVSIGNTGTESHKLFVEGTLHVQGDIITGGNLTTSGSIEASSMSLTGRIHETGYKGNYEGDFKNAYTIDVPHNKVVVGISFKRYTKLHPDREEYTFALRYK